MPETHFCSTDEESRDILTLMMFIQHSACESAENKIGPAKRSNFLRKGSNTAPNVLCEVIFWNCEC